MTPTPVGMRCPECSRDRTKVKTLRSMPSTPMVTQTLIVINVLVFFAEAAGGSGLGSGGGGQIFNKGALFGPLIAHQHEYWRLFTSGFLHAGLFHVFVNMLSLWFIGQMLEPAIGRVNFAAIYVASLFAGSFGALLFQPDSVTVGASGAIFGVFGALIVVARARGIPIWQTGLGTMLVLNLLFSVTFSGISLGGHLGGLIGGLIAGLLVVEVGERRGARSLAIAGCVLIAVISIAGGIAVAGSTGLAPNGIGFGA
jgi:membrane associated rhomboid family serine protease